MGEARRRGTFEQRKAACFIHPSMQGKPIMWSVGADILQWPGPLIYNCVFNLKPKS